MKSRIFIGSSRENIHLAKAIQCNLDNTFETRIWNQNTFTPSQSYLSSLLRQLDEAQFGVFVFAPEDYIQIRNDTAFSVRDNVLFEFGLFMGRFGPEGTFFVSPRGISFHLPSDLDGIAGVHYTPESVSPGDHDRNVAALGAACSTIEGQLKRASEIASIHERWIVHQSRETVNWTALQKSAKQRFWISGTSLRPVHERNMLEKLLKRGVNDIRIILPRTESGCSSFFQLDGFNSVGDLAIEQIYDAQQGFRRLSSQLRKLKLEPERKHLRKYSGVMYSNITIFDDIAIVANYEPPGIGERCTTLEVSKECNPEAFDKIVKSFLLMWDAPDAWGFARLDERKARGTSMIFVNSKNQMLLSLRDEKSDIPYPNKWDLLGGSFENHETPSDCIIREIAEEIGLTIEKPSLFDVFDFPDRYEYTFWGQIDLNLAQVNLTEGQRLRWFSKEEILEMPVGDIAFNFKPVLERFICFLDLGH